GDVAVVGEVGNQVALADRLPRLLLDHPRLGAVRIDADHLDAPLTNRQLGWVLLRRLRDAAHRVVDLEGHPVGDPLIAPKVDVEAALARAADHAAVRRGDHLVALEPLAILLRQDLHLPLRRLEGAGDLCKAILSLTELILPIGPELGDALRAAGLDLPLALLDG